MTTLRKLVSALALTALLGGGFAALAPTVLAQHGEHGEEGVDSGEGEHGEGDVEEGEHHHALGFGDMFWTSEGPNGEPAFLARVIPFFLWAFILYYFGKKPLADFLAVRRRGIVDGLEEAKRVEAAAQAKHEEYTARIENLDAEIAKLREDFKRAGIEERDRMVAEASDRAHKMHAEAHFLVGQQLKTLREQLTRESIEAAVAAAEKILRERATGADQQRLADEYLARLRQSVASGTAPKTGGSA